MLKKKIWAKFQRSEELLPNKIVTKLSKIWVWDPGSRGQKGTGSWIRIRNTAKGEREGKIGPKGTRKEERDWAARSSGRNYLVPIIARMKPSGMDNNFPMGILWFETIIG
jgi:hypothetical protein